MTAAVDADAPFDGILLASYGGPEAQEHVIPFLRNVTRGRAIPEARLEEVAVHYRHNGGTSPITEQNRALIAALEAELERRGIALPVYFGNRNWEPFFEDALVHAHRDGRRRLLGLVTSAYTSYSGVGQYLEDFEGSLAATGLAGTITIEKVREFFDHPGFLDPFIEHVRTAVAELLAEDPTLDAPTELHLQFVTHSIPLTDALASGPEHGEGGAYVAQHLEVARLIVEAAAPGLGWSLVYQSRSGAPHIPWLEPDINEALPERRAAGARAVVIIPIGFISDHMEVMWDLDTEALATCADLGLAARRVPTPGLHPAFVAGLVDLIEERLRDTPVEARPSLSALGVRPDPPASTGLAGDPRVGVPTRGDEPVTAAAGVAR